MESEADVTVAETAQLTAMNTSGKAVDAAGNGLLLAANSTAINKVFAVTTSAQSELTTSKKAPAAGTVTAKKDVAVKATSTDDLKVKASANGAPAAKHSTSSKVNAAVAVMTAGNHSNVTVGEGAAVTSTDGGITVAPDVENKFESIAAVTSNAEAVGATAVSVNVYTGDANVTVGGTLASAKDTTLTATSHTPVNSVTASNDVVPSPARKAEQEAGTTLSDDEEENGLIIKDDLGGFLKEEKLTKLVGDLAETTGAKDTATTNATSQLGKYTDFLTVGASIGVGVSSLDADVTIGKTAKIDAKGALTAKATAPLEDIYMSSLSSMTNTDPDGDNLMVGAAVMVSDIKNKAHVTVEDGTETEHATLHSHDTMTITADSTQVYDRIGGILYDLNKLYADFKALENDAEFDELDASDKAAYKSTLERIGTCISDVNNGISSAAGLDITSFTTNLSTFPTSAVGAIAQIGSLAGGIQKLVSSGKNPNGAFRKEVDGIVRAFQNQVLVWTLPESYFHYSVDSSASNAAGTDAGSLAVAGAANVNLLDSAANVTIGAHAELESAAGAIDIDAVAKQNTAVLNGKPNVGINADIIPTTFESIIYRDGDKTALQKLKDVAKQWTDLFYVAANTDAPNAVGGVVGVAEHATEATVAIGTGAQITGHDATVTTTDDEG